MSDPIEDRQPSGEVDTLVERLLATAEELGAAAARRQLTADPSLLQRFGPSAMTVCAQDMTHHVRHLAAAVSTRRDALFLGYAEWTAQLLMSFDVGMDDLLAGFEHLAATVAEECDEQTSSLVARLLDAAATHLTAAPFNPDLTRSYLDVERPHGRLAQRYLEALLSRDRRTALRHVTDAVRAGASLETIYLEVFQPVLREVGRLWQTRRISVAQEHLVSAATQVAMAQLYHQAFMAPRRGRSVLIASLEGELHEIGARMLADLLEADGWDTTYIGANTPTASLIAMARDLQPDVIALSVTLLANVARAKSVIARLRAETDARIVIGGRPFVMIDDLWTTVGADGTSADAASARQLADQLLAA